MKNEKTKKPRRALKAVAITLAVLVVVIAIVYLVPLFTVLAGEHSDLQGDPKVVIVLGYKLDGEDMPSLLKSRLDTALEYLKDAPNATVIVSGGKGDDEHISEAQCMYDYLVENGVSADRLLVEDRSSTTAENVRFSKQLAEERGLDLSEGVLVVSNEFHLHRIRMLFKRIWKDAKLSTLAAPSLPSSQKALMHLREPFALLSDFLTAR